VFGAPPEVTVVDGGAFCISDPLGDLSGGNQGFFVAGTRFLSRYTLTLDGERLRPLTAGQSRHFEAAFYQRPLKRDPHEQDLVTVTRRRQLAGTAFCDEIIVGNHGPESRTITLALALSADFRAGGKLGEGAREEEPPGQTGALAADGQLLVISDPDADFAYATEITLSRPMRQEGALLVVEVEVAGKSEQQLTILVTARGEGAGEFTADLARVSTETDAWQAQIPQLSVPLWPALERSYYRSAADLGALRFRDPRCPEPMVAAGLPWFMTVFGRDSLITCLETMLFGDSLARATLRVLAALQADADIPEIEAEPGKIIHELRQGKAAARWYPAYYGTVDATPLFLILLSEVHRWSGDDEFARELKEPALRALAWCDDYGDRDGDGFLEFVKRAPTKRGLSVHTWKDSQSSQMFRDGTIARAPIAAAEVQGYVYDAKRRLATVARQAWGDETLARRLEQEAALLFERFNDAFWLPDGYYALALDADKRPVDALASNLGHLLFSGIVPGERVAAVAARLTDPDLFSGWGLRTMAESMEGYSPLVYHNGCVWPHDTVIAAWGLARSFRGSDVLKLAEGLLDAADLFDGQLPELFSGFARAESGFPVAYPASCRPQAWAAGVPVLLLRVLLGLEPVPSERTLVARAAPPPALEGLTLDGVCAFGKRFAVSVVAGQTHIREL
jgi:glycogen debranching enzyme